MLLKDLFLFFSKDMNELGEGNTIIRKKENSMSREYDTISENEEYISNQYILLIVTHITVPSSPSQL